MNRKINILVIILIFIVPVVLYYSFKTAPNLNSVSMAQVIGTKPVVLDFSSQMCMECKELAKNLEPVEKGYKDKIVFKKIIVNSASAEDQKLMNKYNVNVVPTLVFLDKNGKVVRKTEGNLSKEELKGYLNQLEDGKLNKSYNK